MENIKEQLNAEIESEFEDLADLQIGSDEYKVTVDGLTKLVDRAIEIDKIEREYKAKKESRDIDREKIEKEVQVKNNALESDKEKLKLDEEKLKLDKEKLEFEKHKFESEQFDNTQNRIFDDKLKLEQSKNEKIFHWIEVGLAVAGIVIPTGVKIWGTLKTLKFEETGTVTTLSGKAHVNSLFSKK